MPETNTQPMPDERTNWLRKTLGILAADRAIGMAGVMRSRLMAERLARKTQDGTIGKATAAPEDDELKDMQIIIGDQYTTTTTSATTTSPLKRMVPYVLAAALAGGSGVAGAALTSYLASKDDQQPVIVHPQTGTDTDTDTQYNLRLGRGE